MHPLPRQPLTRALRKLGIVTHISMNSIASRVNKNKHWVCFLLECVGAGTHRQRAHTTPNECAHIRGQQPGGQCPAANG
jgi:hypothetical protein